MWKHLDKDVSILMGINGAGKTTLLNAIYDTVTRCYDSNLSEMK